MKKNLRQNKGISMISLAVVVAIMLIMSTILIYNAETGVKIANLNKMYTDIKSLDRKISVYYAELGGIPVLRNGNEPIEYPNDKLSILNDCKNPNDNDKYYIIDLDAIDNITLNYGRDYYNIASNMSVADEKDVYIINEETHTIYYVDGIKLDEKIYYRTDEQYTKINE